jgi:hypothetical protein
VRRNLSTLRRVLQKWLLGPMTLQNLVSRIGSEHVERRLKVDAEHDRSFLVKGYFFSISKIGSSHPG